MIPTRLLDIEINLEVFMIEYNMKFNVIIQPFFITLCFSLSVSTHIFIKFPVNIFTLVG